MTFGTGRIWRWDPRGTKATVLHELAHQWYGDTVTPRDWRDLWLNEGSAMYVQILWDSSHGGWSMQRWVHLLRGWDWWLRREYGPPGAYDRRQFASGNVYYCPALMLHVLRDKLGKRGVLPGAAGLAAAARGEQPVAGVVHPVAVRPGRPEPARLRARVADVAYHPGLAG